jgi:hypothetical protein
MVPKTYVQISWDYPFNFWYKHRPFYFFVHDLVNKMSGKCYETKALICFQVRMVGTGLYVREESFVTQNYHKDSISS